MDSEIFRDQHALLEYITYGVQDRSILGVRVRLTSPARTVVDCFRYRNKIGIEGYPAPSV